MTVLQPQRADTEEDFAAANFAQHLTGYRAVRKPNPQPGETRPWVLVYKNQVLRYSNRQLAESGQWSVSVVHVEDQ